MLLFIPLALDVSIGCALYPVLVVGLEYDLPKS